MRVIRSTAALCLSVSAILAVSAAAAVPGASAAQWHVAGSTLTGSASYTGKATSPFTFTVIAQGNVYKFRAAGVEFLEPSISNEGGTATGRTKIRLTGVTVESPSTCAVVGGKITTYPLKTSAGGGIVSFTPTTGSEGGLFVYSLGAGTGSCPLAGTYVAWGGFSAADAGQATESVTHNLNVLEGSGIQTNLGGSGRMYFGGSISESLSGSYLGQTWSAS